MFEKNMRIAYLCDFYIDLFDEHSQGILRAYYEDDLSLAEIALGEKISRQGIRHIIKKCEETLLFYEEKLGLAKRYAELNEAADTLGLIKKELSSSSIADSDNILHRIDDVIATIQNK